MKVKAEVKNKTNLKKVKEKTQKANFKSIAEATGAIWKTSRRLLRKGTLDKETGKREPSAPGRAPKTWNNRSGRFMKSRVLYKTVSDVYGRSVGMVYANPYDSGTPVFRMLEEGGSQYVEMWRNTGVVDDRTHRRATYQKIKSGEWKVKPMESRSAKEQNAIKDYYGNIRNRKQYKVKVRAKYKARPFLMPAVQRNLSRLPAIWRSAISRYYR